MPKDPSTTVRTQNTLTADKKSIASAKVYENNSLRATTSYTYNADGTVAAKTEQPASGETIVTEYTYAYQPDSSYSVTATVKNVKDADQNTVNISTVQQYDSLGNLVSVTDGNGNTTQYEYDKQGRVTKQTNPDGQL